MYTQVLVRVDHGIALWQRVSWGDSPTNYIGSKLQVELDVEDTVSLSR